MALFLSLFVVLGLLILGEWQWRKHKIHDEFSRKFVHITVGSFVGFWPYFLDWDSIRLLSLAFLITVGLSKKFNLLRAIHSVNRPTVGEIFFALVVGFMTYLTQSKAIYAAALLQMSLADGLAAVIGTRYGQNSRYKVFNQTKSLVGSMTFFGISYLILLSYSLFGGHIGLGWCLLLSASAAGLENLGVQGLDNLIVPLFVAITLTNL